MTLQEAQAYVQRQLPIIREGIKQQVNQSAYSKYGKTMTDLQYQEVYIQVVEKVSGKVGG